MIVIRPNNIPFKNETGAKMYAGRTFVNYKIVPHLEGFGIETDGVKKDEGTVAGIPKKSNDVPF